MQRIIEKTQEMQPIIQKVIEKAPAIQTGVGGGTGSALAVTSVMADIATSFQLAGFILGFFFVAFQFYVSIKRYRKEFKNDKSK